MSSTPFVPSGGGQAVSSPYTSYDDDDPHGQGLVTFAGVMLMIAGVLNTLYGIAAIDTANFFVHNARYVFGDLNTWGWFVLALGVLSSSPRSRSGAAPAGAGGSASPARASTRSCRCSGSPRTRSWH
jgi:hypothetical protein